MNKRRFNIKDDAVAVLLTVALMLSGAVMYIVSSDRDKTAPAETTESAVTSETPETEASDVEESSRETAPAVRQNELLEDMESGMSFCFVGDSITRGSVTEDIPWYEPLTPFIRGEIMNFSEGGWTSSWLVNLEEQAPVADVYVVAIGINDVLFIDRPLGAASAEQFIDNLQMFTDFLLSRNPDAKFYYITPWPFLNFPEEAYECCDEFSNEMKEWCDDHGYICIDPFDTIMTVLSEVDTSVYMYNDYHPNAPEGIGLYSYAVLQGANRAD